MVSSIVAAQKSSLNSKAEAPGTSATAKTILSSSINEDDKISEQYNEKFVGFATVINFVSFITSIFLFLTAMYAFATIWINRKALGNTVMYALIGLMVLILSTIINDFIWRGLYFHAKKTNRRWFLFVGTGFRLVISVLIMTISATPYFYNFEDSLLPIVQQHLYEAIANGDPLIHSVQLNYECCGVEPQAPATWTRKIEIDEMSPVFSYFYTQNPDSRYLSEVRIYRGVPWSCCKTETDCYHVGFERFVRATNRSKNEIDGEERVGTSINWPKISDPSLKKRNELIQSTIRIDKPCAKAVVKVFYENLKASAIFIVAPDGQ